MRRKVLLLLALSLSICLTSGCFRPKETTKYVVLRAGQPGQILQGQPTKMRVRSLATGEIVENESVDGWVTMPQEHWDTVKRNLENGKEKESSEKR